MQSMVRGVWALFLSVALLMLGVGLQGSLLGVRATIEDFGVGVTGVIMSSYYLGFLVSSIIAPRLVTGVGHVRVFAAFASLASTTVLLHALVPTPVFWTLLRFVTGFAVAGLFVVSESWLNQVATNEQRGKVFAIYMMIVSACMALGQFILPLADPEGFTLFIVISIMVSLALVPMTLSRAPAPTILRPETIGLRALYKGSPLGVVACSLCGVTTGSYLSMGPVFGTTIGFNNSQVALFMALPLIGILFFQYPIGALSDRTDRRSVLAGAALISAGAALVAIFAMARSGEALFLAFMIYGAFSSAIYALSIAHVADTLTSEKILPASAMLVLTYSAGSFVGPFATGVAMSEIGPEAFFVLGAVLNVAIALFAFYRMTQRAAVADEDKAEFVPVSTRATAVATVASIDALSDDVTWSTDDDPDPVDVVYVDAESDYPDYEEHMADDASGAAAPR